MIMLGIVIKLYNNIMLANYDNKSYCEYLNTYCKTKIVCYTLNVPNK